MRKPIISLLVLIPALFLAKSSFAVWFWGAKPLGMGTAFTAVADDNNAIQVNPAGIGQISHFNLDANFERREYEISDYPQLHEDDLTQEEDENDFGREYFVQEEETIETHEKNISDFWHVSAVDGKTLPNLPVGVSFTAANFPNRTFDEGKDYRFSLALAGNAGDIFFMGGAAKFIQLSPEDTNFNADFGVLISAVDFFSVGLAGRNVFGSPDPYRIRRDICLGVAGHILDYATVAFDATKVFDVDESNTFNFAAGAEGFVYKQASTRSGLALRGGFLWDQIFARDLYSFGIGWVAPEGILGYTFQGDVENTRNFKHSLHMTMRF